MHGLIWDISDDPPGTWLRPCFPVEHTQSEAYGFLTQSPVTVNMCLVNEENERNTGLATINSNFSVVNHMGQAPAIEIIEYMLSWQVTCVARWVTVKCWITKDALANAGEKIHVFSLHQLFVHQQRENGLLSAE